MFIWITARTIHAGKEDEFREAWQGFLEAGNIPGLVEVQYARQVDDPRKVLGISYWKSRQDCERYRSSQVESDRTKRMNAMVESVDFSTFYESEEIALP